MKLSNYFFQYGLLVIILILNVQQISAQRDTNDFVTTWRTTIPGYPGNKSIVIWTDINYSSLYNYDVDWDNDGIFDNIGLTGGIVHTYQDTGTYTVRIRGRFPSLMFRDQLKLISIDQWGNQQWLNFARGFEGCQNLTYNATDAPNLDSITDLYSLFQECINFNGQINNWDVSTVTSMSRMFDSALVFNQPLSAWDVSNVVGFIGMFQDAYMFDQNINTWDVSSATYMNSMFSSASAFNQPLNSWDVSNVTQMNEMFFKASSFNQPLSQWNTSSLVHLRAMFQDATSFDQNISSWNVSSVSDMTSMFESATAFDQNLGNWNISVAYAMSHMFDGTSLSVSNYDSTLIGWYNSPHTSNGWLGAAGLEFCQAKAVRDSLIAQGWRFFGDRQSSNCILTDINDLEDSSNQHSLISIYPNPTSDYIKIESEKEIEEIRVLSLSGAIVFSARLVQDGLLDVSHLQEGVYFMKVSNRSGSSSHKLVVQK